VRQHHRPAVGTLIAEAIDTRTRSIRGDDVQLTVAIGGKADNICSLCAFPGL
jgi:hypothetical protein